MKGLIPSKVSMFIKLFNQLKSRLNNANKRAVRILEILSED